MICGVKNAPSCASLLLAAGADANAQAGARTPLLFAAMSGAVDVCKVLVDNGADIFFKDDKGRNAAKVAKVSSSPWGYTH